LAPQDSVHLTPRPGSWAAARRGLSLGIPSLRSPLALLSYGFGPPDRVGRTIVASLWYAKVVALDQRVLSYIIWLTSEPYTYMATLTI
jgi:hypothetical protein